MNVVRGQEDVVVCGGAGHKKLTESEIKLNRITRLIKVYAEGEKLAGNAEMEKMVKKNFRAAVLPDLKFIQTGKVFGSFEQPDLTDPNCVAHKLFEMFPAMKNDPDELKARFWMTYRGKLKEIVSTHKAKVTMMMKNRVISGKYQLCLIEND